MPAFHAFDGTELAYHVNGDGEPLDDPELFASAVTEFLT